MTQEERYKHYYNEGYNAGCVKGYEQAIKKACEWLKTEYEDIGIRWMRGDGSDELISRLIKDLKGGEV